VKYQRFQTEVFNHNVKHVGAINATTQTKQTVKLLPARGLLDFINATLKLLSTMFVGMPIRQNHIIKIMVLSRDPLMIEMDIGVRRIQYGFCTDLVVHGGLRVGRKTNFA
jgi:hypothetical protein